MASGHQAQLSVRVPRRDEPAVAAGGNGEEILFLVLVPVDEVPMAMLVADVGRGIRLGRGDGHDSGRDDHDDNQQDHSRATHVFPP